MDCESHVRIGDDNYIREYVTINRATGAGEATVIGNGNWLLAYVHIAHNCVIENQVVITNAASLAGHVWVESRQELVEWLAFISLSMLGVWL